MHRGNHETHQHSAVDPFHLLCCDFVVTNRTTMETQNHHIRCSGCGPGILIGMRERLPGLLRLWNYLSSICRIEPLGSIAPGERNRGGRETRVGIRRLEPLLSRPGPPLDRTRHAGHIVGLLKRVDNPGHSARGYENASDPRRNLPSPTGLRENFASRRPRNTPLQSNFSFRIVSCLVVIREEGSRDFS